MPQRVNSLSDIGTAKIASDSYDVDNIFLTDQGWVYRHFKNHNKTEFWDEIIVAGAVPAGDAPVATTTYSTTGGGSEQWPLAPTYEAGDTLVDLEYGGGASTTTVGGDAGGDGDGSTATDVLLELTGADGTNSYTSAGGANASVTIQAGGTLTITNNSGGHPVTIRVADEGATVSTGTLTGAPAGDGASLTWDTTGVTPGTYYYQCTVHPTMIGEIIVTA